RECRHRRRDRGIDFVARGEVDVLRHGTGGGIEDRAFASGGACDDGTADVMAYPSRRWCVGELAAWLCDLGHGVEPRRVWLTTILFRTLRTAGGTPDRATRDRTRRDPSRARIRSRRRARGLPV